jgi:hypothetical protein
LWFLALTQIETAGDELVLLWNRVGMKKEKRKRGKMEKGGNATPKIAQPSQFPLSSSEC